MVAVALLVPEELELEVEVEDTLLVAVPEGEAVLLPELVDVPLDVKV